MESARNKIRNAPAATCASYKRLPARRGSSVLGSACLGIACLAAPAASAADSAADSTTDGQSTAAAATHTGHNHRATESALPPGIPPENLPMPHADETAETLRASLSVGYESKYMASGMQSAYGSLQTNAELAYYGFTIGLWANNPMDSQESNTAYGPFRPEYQAYINYEAGITEYINASLGFTYYWHPQKGSTPNRHREINLGLGADVLLQPELVYNYDFDLQQHEVAVAISHEESLDPWLPLEGFSIAAGLVFGYLHANKPESNQTPGPQDSMGYIYTEIALDVIYTYKEHLSFYAGPRFASNDSNSGNIADRKNNFWWGMGCTVAF